MVSRTFFCDNCENYGSITLEIGEDATIIAFCPVCGADIEDHIYEDDEGPLEDPD